MKTKEGPFFRKLCISPEDRDEIKQKSSGFFVHNGKSTPTTPKIHCGVKADNA